MGAAGLDVGAGADVFKINANVSKLRNRKHFGNASPHFLEETAEAKTSRQRNRVTANNHNSIINHARTSRGNRASRGRSANRNPSK